MKRGICERVTALDVVSKLIGYDVHIRGVGGLLVYFGEDGPQNERGRLVTDRCTSVSSELRTYVATTIR